jgi:hypothetical protein
MASKDTSPSEKITLSGLLISKEHDYASLPPSELATPRDGTAHSDSDTTATNSSDEFDWDEEENPQTAKDKVKAKRGRAVWMAFMKLARPIRVLLIGVLVAGILITPLLVVNLRFAGNPVSPQVHVWSLWLTIIWAAGCATYLVVDAIPRMVVSIIIMFGGQVERLKTQLEVCGLLVVNLCCNKGLAS